MYTIEDALEEIAKNNYGPPDGYTIRPIALSFQMRWLVTGENFGILETFKSYDEAEREIYKRKAKKYVNNIITEMAQDAGVDENIFKEALLEILTSKQ